MIRRIILSWFTSSLGQHGNKTRRERERARIRAVARDMRRERGLPPLRALER